MLRNLTQATYDRLCEREEQSAPQTKLDVADLLEAYESAMLLLDRVAASGGPAFTPALADFLFTASGDARVDIAEDQ